MRRWAVTIVLMIDDFRPLPRPTESLQENKNSLKVEPIFLPPEQVVTVSSVTPAELVTTSEPPRSRLARLHPHWPPTRKELALGLLLFVIIAGASGAFFALQKSPPPVKSAPVAIKKIVPKPIQPTTVASNLSGLQVNPALNAKPVTGVMIENSEFARPQSGLSQASVVYEAIAEGGITRFLTLFQDTNPTDVGPIRSVRPYYLQWAMGFDAPLAHVGGSPEALNDIQAWGARDLDQFFNSGAYHRISSRDAPHNVYTALDTLTQLAIAKGYTSSTFAPWVRKPEAVNKQVAATAKTIDMTLSGPIYNVHYDYDVVSNSYKRSQAGAPHIDANGSVQISPKVVIGLIVPYALQADGKHSDYGTIGSGQAYIFQDGTVTLGQWTKADSKTNMSFQDAAGQPLPLNPGQTWLTALTAASKITSAP